MTVLRVPVFGIALLVTLAGAAETRADQILWNYNWSSSPGIVYSDNSQTTYITLTNQSLASAEGNSDIVATNLRTYSDAPPTAPATFTAKAYTLSLFLQDVSSGLSGTLTFTGQFDGTLSTLNSNITNTFTGQPVQQLRLGTNLYVATIGPYAPPGPTNSSNAGTISAFAQVTVSSVVIQDVPEPNSLLLAGCAMPLVGFLFWRRRTVGGLAKC
jgi:hypothetical protein